MRKPAPIPVEDTAQCGDGQNESGRSGSVFRGLLPPRHPAPFRGNVQPVYTPRRRAQGPRAHQVAGPPVPVREGFRKVEAVWSEATEGDSGESSPVIVRYGAVTASLSLRYELVDDVAALLGGGVRLGGEF